MGDIVLGRLARVIEQAAGTDTDEEPARLGRWQRMPDALDVLELAVAEGVGRSLIDLDVRVGPYRFLRPELTRVNLPELAVAVFRSYIADPRVEVASREDSLRFRWAAPGDRSPAFHALVDGMAKRLAALARIEVVGWSVESTPHERVLVGTTS